jgi:hypothetical protein
MDAKHFARIRRFLLLTQFDVAVATGVPLGRVGAGERGAVCLDHCELKSISNFLEFRLRMTLEADGERSELETEGIEKLLPPLAQAARAVGA